MNSSEMVSVATPNVDVTNKEEVVETPVTVKENVSIA